jgi:hypothetical protein
VAAAAGLSGRWPDADPLQVQAAQLFADDLAAGRVPSVHAIRTRLHVGQPHAQRAQPTWQASLQDSQPGTPLDRPSASRCPGTTGSSITVCVAPAETAGESSAVLDDFRFQGSAVVHGHSRQFCHAEKGRVFGA